MIWAYISIGLICLSLGGLICYLILKPKLKTVQQLDTVTIQKNKEILQEYAKNIEILEKTKAQLASIETEWLAYSNHLKTQKTQFNEQKQLMQDSMEQLQENLNKNFEEQAIKLGQEYENERQKLSTLYIELQADLTKEGQDKLNEIYKQIKSASDCLADLRSKAAAAVEENRRKEQIVQEELYYRLQIPSSDLLEIKRIKEIEIYLKDPTPLNKVIWKVYYEKPYTDLIGRVFGNNKNVTGIYRITNVLDGRCYVGQAADVPERWRQHIKRGLGAEVPTKNKLYPAMKEIGPENFLFELLEECPRNKLNEREDYWQDFYQAKEFGYSIK